MLQFPVASDRRRFALCLAFDLERRRTKQHIRPRVIIKEAPAARPEKGELNIGMRNCL